MISKNNLKAIQDSKFNKIITKFISGFIFVITLIFCYKLNFVYEENTALVNDKLIDVSSIFFGVFLGCLYLFERFKNNETYQEFLRFCKRLLYLNIIIITLSFIVILVNDKVPESKNIILGKHTYYVRLKSLFFSFYIALFAITLFNIWRFVKIILIILKTNK